MSAMEMCTSHESPSKKNGNRHRFKLIDLFAGAGGLTLGFMEAFGHNFQPVWANDFNEESGASYNANFGQHCVVGDLVELLADPTTRFRKLRLFSADVHSKGGRLVGPS